MQPQDDFHQLALRFTDPVQHDYEVIRPLMLFEDTISARSRATGLDRGTVADKARRFVQHGMFGLIDGRMSTSKGQHPYPAVIAGCILYLKQFYPPIKYREIVRIVARKYGYKTNHVTVQEALPGPPCHPGATSPPHDRVPPV